MASSSHRSMAAAAAVVVVFLSLLLQPATSSRDDKRQEQVQPLRHHRWLPAPAPPSPACPPPPTCPPCPPPPSCHREQIAPGDGAPDEQRPPAAAISSSPADCYAALQTVVKMPAAACDVWSERACVHVMMM
ncbi:hypothetical protein EJB05_03040, partial [Eragrostis curvula]